MIVVKSEVLYHLFNYKLHCQLTNQVHVLRINQMSNKIHQYKCLRSNSNTHKIQIFYTFNSFKIMRSPINRFQRYVTCARVKISNQISKLQNNQPDILTSNKIHNSL